MAILLREPLCASIGVCGLAPAENTSGCPFDSGAPYFLDEERPVLLSVESTGPTCPHSAEETTARVDVILDWIDQALAA